MILRTRWAQRTRTTPGRSLDFWIALSLSRDSETAGALRVSETAVFRLSEERVRFLQHS